MQLFKFNKMIPLSLKLKKESHKNIARAQDLIVETLYKVFNNAVLHGGTALWRCYNGNRFSEDIDVYIPRNLEKINLFFNSLEKKGFVIKKKKISKNSIYSTLIFDRTYVRFEALFKKVNSVLKDYETSESNFITVYTLTPEQFLEEKVDTYLKRIKIRDLYDLFFLLRFIKINQETKRILSRLIENFKKPVDENDLKAIIISGLIPAADSMLEYIKNFLR